MDTPVNPEPGGLPDAHGAAANSSRADSRSPDGRSPDNHSPGERNDESFAARLMKAGNRATGGSTGNSAGNSDVDPAMLAHIQQQILQLAGHLDRLRADLSGLTVRLHQDSLQINALMRHLTDVQSTQLLQERLADFNEQLNAGHEQLNYLSGRLNQLATQDQLVRLATQVATQEQLLDLANTVEKLSRSQHRANLLGETKEQQLESVVASLQDILAARQAVEVERTTHAQAEIETLRREARGEMAVDLLPALDVFDATLAHGQEMLEQRQVEYDAVAGLAQPGGDHTAAGASLLAKLRSRMGSEIDHSTAELLRRLPESLQHGIDELREWLQTISLLRERFINLLQREGVEPILALHQPFDAHLHLAVGSEPRSNVAPDTIIREVRRGYRQGNRTLRHSEVVVALAGPTSPGPTPSTPAPSTST